MGTAWLAATQPGNSAARLGLATSNAGGINEVRAQYAGFFLAVSLVCIATLFGDLSRQTAFIVLIVVFAGQAGLSASFSTAAPPATPRPF